MNPQIYIVSDGKYWTAYAFDDRHGNIEIAKATHESLKVAEAVCLINYDVRLEEENEQQH